MRDVPIAQPPLFVRAPSYRMIGGPRHGYLAKSLPLPIRASGEQHRDDPSLGVGERPQKPAPLPMLQCSTVSKTGGADLSSRLRDGDFMIFSSALPGGTKMMHASSRRVPILGTVLLAALLVFVLISIPAEAAPLSPASTSASPWYYGAVDTITVPLQHASNGWVYGGTATFGYTVTVWDNSTSATTFELTIYRTMGLAYSIRFCDIGCGSPTQWANQTFRLYESTATFANFTTQGSVFLNGTTETPAIALENTSSFLYANVTESTDVFLPSLGQLGPHLGYLGATLVANSTVRFSPALGLFPTVLSPGSTWNSTSLFAAWGSAEWNYYYAAHAPVKTTIIGPASGGASLSARGTVSVQGAYPRGSTFSYGGQTYPAVTLVITGPFDVREGVIFVPVATDLFGSASQPWGANQTGSSTVQMATLDLKPTGTGGLQLIASSYRFSSAAANAATSAQLAPASSGLTTAAANSNPVSSGTVQGEPENEHQATGAQQCLTTGGGCPSAGSSAPRSLVGDIVFLAVVATVAVVVVLAVVTRRRRSPPAVYPNAVLYPPGAAYPSAPSGAPSAPPAPPPPEDDPLDHLW